MKKFIVILIIGIAIGWGFKHLQRNTGSKEHVATGGTISEGEKVELQRYLAPGKFTVFFFYANW